MCAIVQIMEIWTCASQLWFDNLQICCITLERAAIHFSDSRHNFTVGTNDRVTLSSERKFAAYNNFIGLK